MYFIGLLYLNFNSDTPIYNKKNTIKPKERLYSKVK